MATLDRDILKLQPAWLDPQRPRLGRYVLGPVLGQGGMGEVMEAWDVVLCRTVALKVLRNVEPTAVIRFMHEAQIQARIVHPNICRIYDVDATEGNVKIAMQLVRGPNLEQASPELSLTEVVTLMAQVAEAIHAAHRLKLIHRDLKPSNILLERGEDGRWFPYICDFGLAMVMDEPSLTYSNTVIGTPAYMAPEQLRGLRDLVGPATDIYGLGGALYFALIGRAPDGPTPGPGTRPAPSAAVLHPAGQDLPRDLQTILHKCLEADPDQRYPTALALADDLWRYLDGQPIRGTVAGPVGRLWRKARPYVMTGLYAALGAGFLFGAWRFDRNRNARLAAARGEAAWSCAMEAADLAQDLRLERMLPVHDLRPAYARVRARMDRLRARLGLAGDAAGGSGHLALAAILGLLGEAPETLEELAKAKAGGLGPAGAVPVLSYTLAAHSLAVPPGAPASPALTAQALGLLEGGAGTAPAPEGPDRFAEALAAFLRKDYPRAAAEAFVTRQSHPWSGEVEALEGLSLVAQGRRLFDAGELTEAEGRYREVLNSTAAFLERVPSEERVRHVQLLAARGLCLLDLRRGRLTLEAVDRFEDRCDQALRLDPGSGELQGDWIDLQLLEARLLEDLGRDAQAPLAAARAFADIRLKAPLPDSLRNLRLAIQLRSAARTFDHGGDPDPALAQAVRDPAPVPELEEDQLALALAFQARVALARGADPRPAVAAALARLLPGAEERAPWTSCEAAAEAWLVQAEWEAAHGLDSAGSLERARTLVAAGLRKNPRSGSALALEGLICLQELKGAGGSGPDLRLQAQDRLLQSRALGAGGRLQARLAALLARPALKAG